MVKASIAMATLLRSSQLLSDVLLPEHSCEIVAKGSRFPKSFKTGPGQDVAMTHGRENQQRRLGGWIP